MTREKLVDILVTCEIDNVVGCADRIISALEAERVGEVVLGKGKVDWFANIQGGGAYGIKENMHPLESVYHKNGTLIFREDK